MLLLGTFTPWLLLAFVGQHVSLSSARRRGWGTGKSSSRSSSSRVIQGKFPIVADKMQCTWVARDVGDGLTRLLIMCENPEARITGGVTDIACHYNGKPQLCPAYESDRQGFWKQVTRAFKRHQDKVCKDARALIKASSCKSAPRDAHFKLDINSSVMSAQSGDNSEVPATPPPPARSTSKAGAASAVGPAGPTACPGRADPKRKAEEHCSGSWASLCTFFFSMLQSDEC